MHDLARARELGIEQAVRFLGFVSPVSHAFEDAAIAVVPSLGEGFGMVALEAMERARPVIPESIPGGSQPTQTCLQDCRV